MLPPDQVEVVVQRGRTAAALLENGDFLAVVDDLTNMHLAALVASPPGAAGLDAREHHHLLQFALTEIVATLQGYAQAGEAQSRVLQMDADEAEEDTE